MCFGEALELLLQGKKIRRSTWIDGHFIYLVNGKRIQNHKGNSFRFDQFDTTVEWTEYLPNQAKVNSIKNTIKEMEGKIEELKSQLSDLEGF